ncbi:MAG TPA: site-specific integrase [Verrucomicrobiae bacterium]|nr:site-specific integrase [Verrucomicrobiae bacterium]
MTPPQEDTVTPKPANKSRRRDGLFQRRGWWWLDYTDADGKRHRQKGAPDYQTAKLILREKLSAIAKGEALGVRGESIRLSEFVERKYWPTVRANVSPGEAIRARSILDIHILPRFGGTKLAKLRREDIERWQAERRASVSGSTANKELMRLGHILNRAVKWGYLRTNPAKGVERAKEAPGRVRYLSQDERDLLLNGRNVIITAKDGRTWTVRREPNAALRLYILAALQTGARRGELGALTWGDVDMKARTLTFRHTKNGHTRTVPITDTLRDALAGLPRPLSPSASVLPERDPKVLTRAFGRLVKDLGLNNLRFHDLRHDAASTLTMAGVAQRAVMEILGHRDPRMTMRYQHLSPGHLRDAMRALDAAATSSDAGKAAAASAGEGA